MADPKGITGPSTKRLSKSQYCKGRKCLKRVWLYNHKRELATPPGEFQQQLFDQGHEVGRLARTLFPDGTLIEQDHTQPDAALVATKGSWANGCTLFEAAILFDRILIRADIVKVRSDGSIDLIEVKSTNSIKKEHLDDVAVQKYVLEGAGFKVNSCSIMHLNREYVRQGDLELEKLFLITPVDNEIRDNLSEVAEYVKLIRAHLALNQEPLADIGSVCKNPYRCEFYESCWQNVTDDSIHVLTRISPKKRLALVDRGIEYIRDIPDDFDLTENQVVQRACAISNSAHIELDKIKNFTKTLNWPIYFLDFETIQFAIPPIDGTSPYQHLPFQYSLHIQNEPGGPIIHKEFLNTSNTDPRKNFTLRLCSDIPIENGSVVVYYASFERSKIEALANWYGEFSHHLQSIVERLWDLEVPFSKRWYYEHAFGGRSSIKTILPALVPDLSYSDLKIQKGDVAQTRYLELITSEDQSEKENAAQELRAYCQRDTWAMVQILRVLYEITGKPGLFPKAA